MKEKFFHWVIRFRIPISYLSLAASLFCAIASRQVKVNYDMNDYLPAESLSTISLDKMKEEFEGDIPNARVAIKNVSYSEALDYKEKLEEISGVDTVTWLDDSNPLDLPLSMLDEDTVTTYYKDNTALYTVTIHFKLRNKLNVWRDLLCHQCCGKHTAIGRFFGLFRIFDPPFSGMPHAVRRS